MTFSLTNFINSEIEFGGYKNIWNLPAVEMLFFLTFLYYIPVVQKGMLERN